MVSDVKVQAALRLLKKACRLDIVRKGALGSLWPARRAASGVRRPFWPVRHRAWERDKGNGPRDRWELHFPAATGNARLPLVALGPESSGSGSTLALARIHAGAPAQLGHPRVR
ncbi:hypothetical protein NDU88_001204 [Pleurodeles waltl]|uniref:Uncharacterized protein n=1 Tax=Pleurodeles waltl TaxID=8319 RepID=A0AAV7S7E2_PLEWA|nr:hypothetical protein NDU88_001204 [Pleurodeles waltl]